MMLRNVAAFFAVACMSCDAFAPARTLVLPQVSTMQFQSQNAKFAPLSNSMQMKKANTARYMSAVADVPEPEKKGMLEKVRYFL